MAKRESGKGSRTGKRDRRNLTLRTVTGLQALEEPYRVWDTDVPQFFDQEKLDQLKERQVETVRYLDGVFVELFDRAPKNTWIIVTADHGELFGEAGYFGHGPIMHEKCFEVPYLEGKLR